ncbi:MAG: M23 family metallopeptidase [Actinomyces sp.]|nr:M23 family metallopeptidase [Actinomyces sp.]
MTFVIPQRGRFGTFSLISAVVGALLIIATPSGVATPHRERWQWPTGEPVPVVEGFAPPAHDWLPGRRGVTLQYPAPSPVYACASGTVTTAGPVAGRGVISIRHDVGGRVIWSTYLPVTPSVAVGDRVEKGDVIGVVEGDSPTLHWGAKTGRRTYIDPIRLTLGHPRLLPWDDAPTQ